MNDTAILIITFNSAEVIGPCLEAAVATGARVLVVDNASEDGTVAIVRDYPVRLIANPVNRGFAGAVNQGVRQCSANYILLLNPDAVIVEGFNELRHLCETRNVAAVAGVLLDSLGEPQTGFTVRRLPTPAALSFEVLGLNRLFPGNSVNWRFRCSDLDLSGPDPLEVEQPAGAFLLFRRAAWERVGGFDERFHPLWFEDVDFCSRLKALGERILLTPRARATHSGAHSILNMRLEIRRIYWYGNLLRYASKHFPATGRSLVCLATLTGAGLRLIGDRWNGQQRGEYSRVWASIARLAVGCLLRRPGWDKLPERSGASN